MPIQSKKAELTENLELLLAAYQTAPGAFAAATVAKRAAGNDEFFTRLADPEFNFGVMTYDRIVQWAADNWLPGGKAWPREVPRPTKTRANAA